MNITNLTSQDYWFGPLHLPASGSLTVDDTSATSLYLTDDSVADAINYLYSQVPAKITVTSAAAPFPRPTGVPSMLHGDGSPEGLVYASEGTLFLRRDNANVYQKRSMVHLNTGWTLLGQSNRDQVKRLGLGYKGETFDLDCATSPLVFTSGDCRAGACGLLAGDVVINLLLWCTANIQTITTLKVGIWDSGGNLIANSANSTTNLTASTITSFALSTPFVVPADNLYYMGCIIVATTMGSLASWTVLGGKLGGLGGSNPKNSIVKAGQADIPSTLGTTGGDAPWVGWN